MILSFVSFYFFTNKKRRSADVAGLCNMSFAILSVASFIVASFIVAVSAVATAASISCSI